ncbi:MAG: helix-turn-helix transcriptional regulator [Pseudobdellovibrionaceae bacterium]
MKKTNWHSLLTPQAEISLKETGQLLTEARKRRGLSVIEVARRVGVDRRTIAQLEMGHPGVSLGVFFQVMNLFNLLPGLKEVFLPENDLEALSTQIRQLRRGRVNRKKISKSEVDF